VALSETAREAVALSAKLSNEQNNPVPGPDGRVVYTFGVGQPTLVATPLRVSSIELQAGEKDPGRASDWRLGAMDRDADLYRGPETLLRRFWL
jgi:hypothetical protein